MFSILLFTGLLILSLLMVHWVNQREQRYRMVRRRQRHIRWRIDALEEVLVRLEEILGQAAIPRCINQEILHLLQSSLELEQGQSTHLETRIAHVEERDQALAEGTARAHPNRLCESDLQLARSKDYLEQACRVLRRQHNQGRLDGEALNTHMHELKWTQLMVEVITHVAEGHKTLQRGDITASQAYYKKAQGLLISSDHPYPQRMDMIRELGEVIQGKRKALSLTLMPEDDYNP